MSANARHLTFDPSGVLDAGALARLAELDPQGSAGLLQRVLGTYAASLQRAAQELAAQRAAPQHDALRLLAHTLKSSSASVGALALSALCAQVESNVRSARPDGLDAQLDAMRAEIARVSATLQAMLGASGRPGAV